MRRFLEPTACTQLSGAPARFWREHTAASFNYALRWSGERMTALKAPLQYSTSLR